VFWLSHHSPAEYHRTYALGRLRVCARCAGLYPALLAALGAQFAARAPLASAWDLPLGVGLLAPALVDWAVGQARPGAGSNGWRTATGVLLGLALGRTLYVHFQRPWPQALVAQAALVTAVAVPVILLRLGRREG